MLLLVNFDPSKHNLLLCIILCSHPVQSYTNQMQVAAVARAIHIPDIGHCTALGSIWRSIML